VSSSALMVLKAGKAFAPPTFLPTASTSSDQAEEIGGAGAALIDGAS